MTHEEEKSKIEPGGIRLTEIATPFKDVAYLLGLLRAFGYSPEQVTRLLRVEIEVGMISGLDGYFDAIGSCVRASSKPQEGQR